MARTKKPAAVDAVEKPERAARGSFQSIADPQYVARRDELRERIPTALGVICRYRGWTHAQLGEIMGLSPAALKHRIYGRTEFSAAELIALSERIGIPVQAFFDPEFPFEEVLRRS